MNEYCRVADIAVYEELGGRELIVIIYIYATESGMPYCLCFQFLLGRVSAGGSFWE